ncbi:MAG TPA: efflux RND transporter periplasmic adaptor subunit [Azospirillaceae bacterium]|nr:efflux RND transporter periplasmic adaptor subunit [Azospirillaceae bacterium]
MRMRRFLPPVMLLAPLLLAACGDGEQSAAGQAQRPPPQVAVVETRPADLSFTSEYAGRAAGVREVEVRARVAGILVRRAYQEGAPVKEGDLLFQIDPAQFEVALQQAQAALEQARARLNQARQNNERIQALFRRGNASAQSRENAQAEFDQARAELASAEAQVEGARINLDYAAVEAPVSGVTSLEAVSEGSLVGTSADNSLLTRITQVDPVYVNFAVPEAELVRVRQQVAAGQVRLAREGGLPVRIRYGEGTEHPHEGRINFLDAIVDPQTGTVRVRAEVPNPEHTLLPGQFVRVEVQGFTLPNAISVPLTALMQGPQGPFVYVVDAESKAEARPIRTGRTLGDRLVVTEGLKPGERVVSEGVIKARPGEPVRVAGAGPAPPADTAAAAPGGGP